MNPYALPSGTRWPEGSSSSTARWEARESRFISSEKHSNSVNEGKPTCGVPQHWATSVSSSSMTLRGIFKIWVTLQIDNSVCCDPPPRALIPDFKSLITHTWSLGSQVRLPPMPLTVVPGLPAAGFQLSASPRGGAEDVTAAVVVFPPHLLMNEADGDGRRVRICGGARTRLTPDNGRWTCWCFP